MGYSEIAALIRGTNHLLVLSGAGISTPSGIPDFRSGENGLWRKLDPLEYASLTTFRTHPERFFEWIRPLVSVILNAQPNAAHRVLAEFEQMGIPTTILTQNIDGLHQAAGSNVVHELHGSIRTLACTDCFARFSLQEFISEFVSDFRLPRCPGCGNILKPDVILFQEQLPWQPWQTALNLASACDVLLVLGASLEVLPVAKLPLIATDHGARLIVINQTPSYIDERADQILYEDLAMALPEIINELSKQP